VCKEGFLFLKKKKDKNIHTVFRSVKNKKGRKDIYHLSIERLVGSVNTQYKQKAIAATHSTADSLPELRLEKLG
jgi:hypothetical protein